MLLPGFKLYFFIQTAVKFMEDLQVSAWELVHKQKEQTVKLKLNLHFNGNEGCLVRNKGRLLLYIVEQVIQIIFYFDFAHRMGKEHVGSLRWDVFATLMCSING